MARSAAHPRATSLLPPSGITAWPACEKCAEQHKGVNAGICYIISCFLFMFILFYSDPFFSSFLLLSFSCYDIVWDDSLLFLR